MSSERAEATVIRAKRMHVRKPPVQAAAVSKSVSSGSGTATVIRAVTGIAHAKAVDRAEATLYRPHSLATEKATAIVIRFAEGRGKSYSDETARATHVVEFTDQELELMTAVASEMFFK